MVRQLHEVTDDVYEYVPQTEVVTISQTWRSLQNSFAQWHLEDVSEHHPHSPPFDTLVTSLSPKDTRTVKRKLFRLTVSSKAGN